MNNLLTFLLSLNLLLTLTLVLVFWIVNKNCSLCHQEMNPQRVFTLKDKCQACERSPWAFDKDQERRQT